MNIYKFIFLVIIALYFSNANAFPTDNDKGSKLQDLHNMASYIGSNNKVDTTGNNILRTHPWIALEAIRSFKIQFPNAPLSNTIITEIVFGSIEEDYDSNCTDPNNNVAIPSCNSTPSKYKNLDWNSNVWKSTDHDRCVNHFFAGSNNNDEAHSFGRLTDLGTDVLFDNVSAAKWIFSPDNHTGFNLIKNGSDEATRARALGHLIHLISDMTSPAHTRNDAHPSVDAHEKYLEKNLNTFKGLDAHYDKNMLFCFALENIDKYFTDLSDWTQKHYFSDETINLDNFEDMVLSNPAFDFVDMEVPGSSDSIYYLVSKESGNNGDRLARFGSDSLDRLDEECKQVADYDSCVSEVLNQEADKPSNLEIDADCSKDFIKTILPKIVSYSAALLAYSYQDITGEPLNGSNGIINGSFESHDFRGWTVGGDSNYQLVQGAMKHGGQNAAALGRWDTAFHGGDSAIEPYGYEWIYQDVVVPNNITYLKFYWWMETYDTAVWDWFDAYIMDTNGTTLKSILSHAGKPGSNYGPYWSTKMAYGGTGWQEVKVNITAYRGQKIRIYFDQRLDGYGDQQRVYIDDVTLE